MPFTVASWNINGVRARLPHVKRYLEERSPDVLCLQETKVAHGDFPTAQFRELGYDAAVLASGHYAGVALLTREPLERSVYGLDDFKPQRPAARRLAGKVGRVWVDTVYVPTRMKIGKVAFLDALREDHARRYGLRAAVIVCGDFNICWDKRDMAAPNMISDSNVHPGRPEDLAFRRLVEERGLIDCFRKQCDEGGHYSWFPVTPGAVERNRGMRLDYLFASATLAEHLVACEHDSEPRLWDAPSDHLPVRATFDFDPTGGPSGVTAAPSA